MKWKIFFLNIDQLSELPMAESSLFHSEIAEGKKEFLKKLCFTLKKGMLCTPYFLKYEMSAWQELNEKSTGDAHF